VIYYRMFDDVEHPTLATPGSACIDIRAYCPNGDVIIDPGQRVLVRTGLKLDIPDDFSVRLHPRSGLAIKHGITLINAEGVIDADYVEEVKVPIINLGDLQYTINHGDRICQAETARNYSTKPYEILSPPPPKTERAGGFGSTGKN